MPFLLHTLESSRAKSSLRALVEPRPPSASSSILSRWLGIADANNAGNVHGGLIMRMCDDVAGIAAVRHCGGRVVTPSMDPLELNDRSTEPANLASSCRGQPTRT